MHSLLCCCLSRSLDFFLCYLLFRRAYVFFFFFSSRRRHTRLQGDWSSDVCSSDLCNARSARSSPVCAKRRAPLTTEIKKAVKVSTGSMALGECNWMGTDFATASA